VFALAGDSTITRDLPINTFAARSFGGSVSRAVQSDTPQRVRIYKKEDWSGQAKKLLLPKN
ncbi:MAG TPA: hypothetical protein PKH01_06500, partial [Pseudomonadales bacterium]|nr:hypothetical protein [Pseudomonadales bacterium]